MRRCGGILSGHIGHHRFECVHLGQILGNQCRYFGMTHHFLVEHLTGRKTVRDAVGECAEDGRREVGLVHGPHVSKLHLPIDEEVSVFAVDANENHVCLLIAVHSNQPVRYAVSENFVVQWFFGPLRADGTNDFESTIAQMLRTDDFIELWNRGLHQMLGVCV